MNDKPWSWPQFLIAVLLFGRIVIDIAQGLGDEKLGGLGKLIYFAIAFAFMALWIVALSAGGFW